MMFLQRLLSSAILIKSSCVRPVHVLILSIQLILGLPRPPGTVPWMISFSKHDPSFLMMCPKYFIFLSFTVPSNFLSTPAFSSTHLFVRFSVHDICITILKHFISKASILLSSSFLIVQPSHPYIATGHTNDLRSSIFVVTLISWLFQILLRSVAIAYPFASLILISVAQSLSLVIADPKYMKVSTCSKVSSFIQI